MFIKDKSFKKFYDIQLPNNLPYVFFYIPKLFYEDFYTKFNEIFDLLKYYEKHRIQIKNEQKNVKANTIFLGF